ncbi:MAG: SUMF1/EgtB/PvdO family nonheme iron enzyme [Phycisphaerales bacterium]|jgi:formylglycine-generating enzyme required for sulfatase activity|nr:SUMF1/EgtB/PvdO family nonheme iron enzyme [Phycisphaerales bacterium]
MPNKILITVLLLAAFAAPVFAAPKKQGRFNNGDTPVNTVASARRMIVDLTKSHGDKYKGGKEFAARLDAIEAKLKTNAGDKDAKASLEKLVTEASLANPLLDFDKLIVIRRTKEANRNLNAYTSDTIRRTGWDNDIAELSNLRGEVKVRQIYQHPNKSVMKHMDLHFSAQKIMFSGVGANGRWAILEVDANGKNLKELTPSDQKDVQWFDGCYLPAEGEIVGCSTAGMQGLPCVNGGQPMVNLYKVNTKTGKIRQLTFEQDSDWHPRVHHNGRVLYLRWEYTDTPHYFSRYMFHMNPDGTGQMELWGSGSYFPTAYCWARPVPNHPSMLLGTVSGHHAKSETGRLMLVNPAINRKYPFKYTPKDKVWGKPNSRINIRTKVLPASETGCVQEIPGWGKDVVGNVVDDQGGGQKYTFGTPYPLSDKYFLVSLKGFSKSGAWTLCLVDIFDNMTTIYSDKKYSIFEPMPFVPRKTPPVIADRTIEGAPVSVFCTDVYGGRGLKGIPRGKVKKLRVFAYHYGYMRSGGHESVGLESSWDIKRILGTVPVESDGSFSFNAPSDTPLAIQPLDEDGAALALMRSWMVGMPGERMACNGCHEDLNEATPAKRTKAAMRPPSKITPWHGPVRPFSYQTEIQPMLNKYCVGCHNEKNNKAKGMIAFDKGGSSWKSDKSYLNLVAFTRHPGAESDLDMYNAMEWHATTSPLIQMFRKGHKNVKLDTEAWERLYTWIDLNSPHRGMWNNSKGEKRRLDLAKLYAGLGDNPEEEHRVALAAVKKDIKPIMPKAMAKVKPDGLTASGYPFDAAKAKKLAGTAAPIELTLADGVTMKLAPIPAGEFVMGSQAGYPDEAPRATTKIAKAFHMGICEVTNKQYAAFDPKHDTRYLDENGKDHSTPGYIANHADQPVARITWQQATAFCKWLSKKSGKKVTLPTEAQWEWAARGGSDKQFFYGDKDTDFSKHANLADAGRRKTYCKWDGGSKIHGRKDFPKDYLFPLRDDRFTDKWFIVDFVKQYDANPFGLYDIVGNVCEWTRSSYKPYPYKDDDRNNGSLTDKKVARGGSWADRPKTAGSSVRMPYESYQTVYNVGFRVIVE